LTQGVNDEVAEAGSLLFPEMIEDLLAHPLFPKTVDVVCDAFDGFGAVRFRLEEGAYIISHLDQAMNIHLRLLRFDNVSLL
jgi:hypothetical protein